MDAWRSELLAVSGRIVVLCHERVRAQCEHLLKSGIETDHARLREIECRRDTLLLKRRHLLSLGRFVV